MQDDDVKLPGKPERDKLLARWQRLKSERSSWVDHWRDISTNLLPRSGRFLVTDRNKGERRHNAIYDSTGTRALRVLAAGMMAGMTSPARPWFRLEVTDRDLMKSEPVKVWLADTTRLLMDVFAASNTYRALHSIYGELGAFGTGCSIVVPDRRAVIHHHPLTAGEFCLAVDGKGSVATLYREFQKTVGALVNEFGIDKVSPAVKNLHDRGNLDEWVTVVHAVEPRGDRDPRKADSLNMAWRSTYFELGADKDRLLSDGGFKQFPVLGPRWDVISSNDVYGGSPAMEALGDIRQLQHQQLRKAQGIDAQTRPPLQVPSSLRGFEVQTLPGGITYVDANSPHGGVRPLFEAPIDLQHLLMDIQDVRERINSAFYADLFLMLASAPANQRMTATEVAERHEEKLLMLGPVIERLDNELLTPLVEMSFARLVGSGALPPPPPELQAAELNVRFVSILAQAQRAVGTNAIDRYVGNLGAVAQMKPDVLDRFDHDQWAEAYADMLGVDPDLIVADDKVALVRQQRAQAQAAAQQLAGAQQAAETAQTLSQTDTSSPSALQNVMSMFSGYTQ